MFSNEKKVTNNDVDIDTDLITVNNFFVHLIKEISITRYNNNRQLMPMFLPYEIYQYSDAVLKYLPEKSLKKLQKTILFSNKPVVYNKAVIDRGIDNSATFADITNDDRITLFRDQLKDEFVYRIPLQHFTNIGKINFPSKLDFKIKCQLETDMKKLFESEAPDAKIIFTKAPFIHYEEFLLDKNFRQYIETIMISNKILRMGVQKTPLQNIYEISVGSNSINVEFFGSIDNLIGSKFLSFMIKAINTQQYMIATTSSLLQK